MNEKKFSLKRNLDVVKINNEYCFGITPPSAIKISSFPNYFELLIQRLGQKGLTNEECIELVNDSFPEITTEEITSLLDELKTLNIITESYELNRYDRHELYFDLLGVKKEKYQASLIDKSVGIVGFGGIGTMVATLLTVSGIGNLVISDGDRIEESNLTRTLLFDETDIGSFKVEVGKKNLLKRNRSVNIKTVNTGYTYPNFIKENFSQCDFIVLSADSPAKIHEWTNDACLNLNIPFVNAGYVEHWGSIGPMIVPGVTACYKCLQQTILNQEKVALQLNSKFQASSYGPLNTIVAGIVSNEIIRFFLNLEVKTLSKRLFIDSISYQTVSINIPKLNTCNCSSKSTTKAEEFSELANNYEQHRTNSLNSLFLDKHIVNIVLSHNPSTVLDVGCGIGTIALELIKRKIFVTGIEISEKMLQSFKRQITQDYAGCVQLINDNAGTAKIEEKYDLILFNLILDHLNSPDIVLKKYKQNLNRGGRIIIVLPHPFKDSGTWSKTNEKGTWVYRDFVVENYFYEGPLAKKREDDRGNTSIEEIVTYKRNISTYINMLTSCGLSIINVSEPRPNKSASSENVNAVKSVQIPYFLVFECQSNEA